MELWTNSACFGYVIKALESLGYKPDEIQRVVNEMKYEGFEWTTLEEAEQHYQRSSY
jgi:Holliday junction resolvasome RuvABC DNA-binding subunit